jgi:hypothetical protein
MGRIGECDSEYPEYLFLLRCTLNETHLEKLDLQHRHHEGHHDSAALSVIAKVGGIFGDEGKDYHLPLCWGLE